MISVVCTYIGMHITIVAYTSYVHTFSVKGAAMVGSSIDVIPYKNHAKF